MTEGEYKLLIGFINRDILTGVDGGLRRAVKALFIDHGKLLDQVVELGGKELARQYWENWANESQDSPTESGKETK